MKRNLLDKLNRPLRDLRISVTDQCNFRCRYCMPEEIFGPDYSFLASDNILSFEEIERLASIFVSLGVKKLRITGGEPLLRKDLPELIQRLKQIPGVEDIGLTTNGSLLKKFAGDLYQAGLTRVTVSLDSLDEERFAYLNGHRGKVKTVLEGIESASAVGMQVKVNMVIQKGKNDQDIIPMAQYFKDKKHNSSFYRIHGCRKFDGWKMDDVRVTQEIIHAINEVMPLEPISENYYGEVATRYRYVNSSQEIGVISSVTNSFCSTCTRARISAEGKLYTCLFAIKGFDLRELIRSGQNDDVIANAISEVWGQRLDRYSDERLSHTSVRSGSKVEMSHIGG